MGYLRNALLPLALLCLIACAAGTEPVRDSTGEISSTAMFQQETTPPGRASQSENPAPEPAEAEPQPVMLPKPESAPEPQQHQSEPAEPEPGIRDAREVYRTLYPSYSREVKQIAYDVTNPTGEMMGFGYKMRLQIQRQGEWEDCPVIPLPENASMIRPAIAGPFAEPDATYRSSALLDTWATNGTTMVDSSLLEKGVIQPVDCPLYEFPLEEGTYRLIDGNKDHQYSNPFTVTDEPSGMQAQLIERMSGVPGLEHVKFSPHDFTVPFAYQGVISDFETSGIKLYAFLIPDFQEAQAVYQGIREDGYVINYVYRKDGEFIPGMERRYNWEDPPHFWPDGSVLYLYCGDDMALLETLRERLQTVNPLAG